MRRATIDKIKSDVVWRIRPYIRGASCEARRAEQRRERGATEVESDALVDAEVFRQRSLIGESTGGSSGDNVFYRCPVARYGSTLISYVAAVDDDDPVIRR